MDKDLARLQRAADANPADVGVARSLEATLARLGESDLLLERYRFKFICSLSFEDLGQTHDPAVRHCSECKRDVHAVVDPAEYLASAEAGHCVSVPASVIDQVLKQLADEPTVHGAAEAESVCLVQRTAFPMDERLLDWEPKCLLLTPGKPLDHNESGWERVSFLSANANAVVLDVSANASLNSRSLGHLVKLGDALASRGGVLVLLAPAVTDSRPDGVRLVVEMLGLTAFFFMATTLDEAREVVVNRPPPPPPRPAQPMMLGRISPRGR